VGTGSQNTGEGASTAASGGSYGGTGAGNPVGHYAVFGNMTAPTKYGGSGYQATESTGRGGGQLHLEVNSRATVEGKIDVSGNGGGSGVFCHRHQLVHLLKYLTVIIITIIVASSCCKLPHPVLRAESIHRSANKKVSNECRC
jgi:hypothetical protein